MAKTGMVIFYQVLLTALVLLYAFDIMILLDFVLCLIVVIVFVLIDILEEIKCRKGKTNG